MTVIRESERKAMRDEVADSRTRRLARAARIGIAAAAVLILAALPLRAQTKTVRAAADSSAKTLADLPPAALPAISSVLGHDDARYGVLKTADGYSAQNAANHLAAHYAAQGVEFRSQNANLDFEFQGWGYDEHPTNKKEAAVEPSANANRVEYRRGALTEWYVNGPLGIEQGFTISQPPVTLADSNHDALDIALRLRGNLSASVETGRHALTLRDQKGAPALRYGPLLAYDASGRELESWMEVRDGSLRLRVNTTGAHYPIIVDPWVQAAELTNSSGLAGDALGRAIAIDEAGDTVVVGAPYAKINGQAAQGAAYVFVEPTNGNGWVSTGTYTAELTNNSGLAGDNFGWSVAISGNTIVVGSPSATNMNQGAAYVFVEPTTAGGWADQPSENATAELTPSARAMDDLFGYSVAISGNTLVVGAAQGNGGPGAAYVFVESAWSGSVTSNIELTASDGVAGDNFGSSVGINESGNTIVVGAPQAFTGPGAAYVFVQPKSGPWATTSIFSAKLTTSNGVAEDDFGQSASINETGDTVVAGAPNLKIGSNIGQGAAYVFVEPTTAGGWADQPSENETAELTASSGSTSTALGYSVRISGNTVVAGATGVTIGSNLAAGAAYVFDEPTTAGGWKDQPSEHETAELTASNGVAQTFLGLSVGISGNTVVAGAPGINFGANSVPGAAYVFTQAGGSGPFAQYSPTQVAFGNVADNVPASQTVTVTNTGSQPLIILLVTPSADGTIFTITQSTCGGVVSSPPLFPITISSNSSCAFTVQFDPTAPGAINLTLGFEDNAGVGQSNVFSTQSGSNFLQSLPLTGTGGAPFANYTNSTSGSPTQVSFGNVAENTTSTQTLTLSNTGTAPLILQATAVSPPGIFSYTQLACNSVSVPLPLSFPFTINAGASCVFTMQFDPNALGPLGGAVSFVDNAAAGESNLTSVTQGPNFGQAVQLSGNGVAPAAIATTTKINSTTSTSKLGFSFPSNTALVDGPPVTVNFTVQQASGSTTPTGTVVVTDGFGDTCTTTTLNSGAGMCTIPMITQLGMGNTPPDTTPLNAAYTPFANSMFLASSTLTAVPPTSVTENLVEMFSPCTNAGTTHSKPTPIQQQTVTTVCLSGNLNVVPIVAWETDCMPHEKCSVTVSPQTPGAPDYTITLTSISTDAGVKGPLPNAPPRRGPWMLTIFEFVALLSILMALRLTRQHRTRLRLSCAAGLLCVLVLGGMSSCGGPAGAPPGNYTVNLTITAGQFQLVVPVTVTVPK